MKGANIIAKEKQTNPFFFFYGINTKAEAFIENSTLIHFLENIEKNYFTSKLE